MKTINYFKLKLNFLNGAESQELDIIMAFSKFRNLLNSSSLLASFLHDVMHNFWRKSLQQTQTAQTAAKFNLDIEAVF